MEKNKQNQLIICGGIGIFLLLVAIIFQGDIRYAIEKIRWNIEQAQYKRERAQREKELARQREIQEQKQEIINQRTEKFIRLIDAFPGSYQIKQLGFKNSFRENPPSLPWIIRWKLIRTST